ncbi:RagB/SusD family nutrient uptake outer membrane protein [Hymenobacter sediminis]|uniref:RagB/SusD family nutrient uptake outer membrane protein n=1 Tax=Hymenobacter sediminis TaxID=2218621 RepID=UPI000DA68E5D|nr:RagB/SusD family nutrient uptake outer membrane protein [Hymenobacter sediminis]RPD47238.1 RagB/SusD family nutrient uptake outer membrane protein [Hymenobacter sediminis]
MKTFKQLLTLSLFMASLGLGSSSCSEDRLDVQPKTSLASELAFDTPSRVLLQVNNMYDYMKSGSFLGGRYQVYGDIRADDFINRTSNGVTGSAVWQNNLTEASQNDVINMWGAAYQAINQINVFLAGIDANTAKFSAAPFPANYAATANGFKGEGHLLRALAYYSLLQFYARPYTDGNGSKPGLPLRLQAETELGNNNLARSSVAEVYAQILKDLDFAESNLPLTNITVTRAHRNTAIALKTRVLLSMGRYEDVVKEANKIVSTTAPFQATTGVPLSLSPNVTSLFSPTPNASEVILAFPFTTQDAPGTQNQLAYYYLPAAQGGNGEYNLNTSGVISNPRFIDTVDTRLINFVTTAGNTKYLRKYTNGTLSATPYTDNAPVIRYAEVLLNLSEALARTEGATSTRALDLLNAVRERSNPNPDPKKPNPALYTSASFSSSFSIIDAILLERRLEFLGEGLRNNDIMRLLQPIPAKSVVPAVLPTSPSYIWPIPNSELAANTLMTRN